MRFALSHEQQDLKASARDFLAARSPLASVREAAETEDGYSRALWSELARELGVHAVAIPEAYGGAGFTFVELAVVCEELGAALVPGPFLSGVVLAASALLAGSDEDAKRELLPGIADGSVTATLATVEGPRDWDPASATLEALPAAGGHVLCGEKAFVLDGHSADLLLVTARLDRDVRLFAVAGGAAGLERVKLPALDATRSQARLRFADTPARLIADDDAAGSVAAAYRLGAIALAAEQVGGARRALDMSVRYACDRSAFGRPIGSFQALKHMCADNFIAIESAWSAVYYAAWAAAHGPEEVPAMASLAQAFASEAFYRAAADNVQLHGGIGITWECDAQLYLKRAKASELLLGDPAHHRELLARQIGI
jgi:alkylation response protein AidB-like acyl-CoA dehydrogenase